MPTDHAVTVLTRRVTDLEDEVRTMKRQLDRMEVLLKEIAERQYEAAVAAVIKSRPGG